MKITERLRTLALNNRFSTLAFAAAVSAGMLTGCATTDTASSSPGVFKFTVFHYKDAVDINTWTYNTTRNERPEGAAINVATLITHGDVDTWLGRWNPTERPNLSPEDRAALAEKWASLKDGRLAVVNRVVSGVNTVVELTVTTKDQQQQKLQVPLSYANGEWELTSVDPTSEFLNWESSNNKIVVDVDAQPMSAYLSQSAPAGIAATGEGN
jgi:hypothetical protein